MRSICREFIGRQSQLQDAREALRRAEARQPSVLLVTGEAGIGKTRLTEELMRAAEGRFRVLRGACVDTVGLELPYAPLEAALRDVPTDELAAGVDALGVDISGVLPRLRRDEPAPAASNDAADQARLYGALAELLRSLTEQAPVLLVLEDAHWADRSTLGFLSYLARNLRNERLVVVATARAEALERSVTTSDQLLRRQFAELGRLRHVERVELRPLAREEIARFVECVLEEAPEATVVERIVERSSGNPYHIEELLALATTQQGANGVPREVAEMVLLRFEGLSAGARALVVAAAGLARSARPALLGAAGGLDGDALSSALHEAVGAWLLVRESDEDFTFRHALAREAIYAELLPGERRALHDRIATSLDADAANTSAAELAHHWYAAGADAPAFVASLEAARHADALYASVEALAHYSRVLELWDRAADAVAGLDVDHVDVLASAAEAAYSAAEHERCLELWQQALDEVDAAVDPQRAAWLHQRLGRSQPWNVEASLACYEEALRLLPDSPSAQRASLLGDLAFGLTFDDRWEEASEYARRALDIAHAVDAATEEASARSTLGVALAFLGRWEDGAHELRAALAVASGLNAPKLHVRVLLDLAEVLRLGGRFAEALDVMRDGERVAFAAGMEQSVGAFMIANAAEDELRLGRWDDAARSLDKLDGREFGPPTKVTRDSIAGRLAAARGDFATAEARFARAVELCEEVQATEFMPALRAGLAELSLWRRSPDEARTHIVAGLHAIQESPAPLHAPVLFSVGARAQADAAERARANGVENAAADRLRDATALLAKLDTIIERHPGVGASDALAHRALVVAELARLRGDASPASWEEAAALWDAAAGPYWAAYARWRMGEAQIVGRSAPRDAARAALQGARETATALGARPLLDEIEALAQRARIALTSDRPKDDATRPRVPAAAEQLGLTEREWEVLELLAEGLTDREIGEHLFVSPRTAGTHVHRILRKLSVTTRTAAAAKARQLGWLDDGGGGGQPDDRGSEG